MHHTVQNPHAPGGRPEFLIVDDTRQQVVAVTWEPEHATHIADALNAADDNRRRQHAHLVAVLLPEDAAARVLAHERLHEILDAQP